LVDICLKNWDLILEFFRKRECWLLANRENPSPFYQSMDIYRFSKAAFAEFIIHFSEYMANCTFQIPHSEEFM